MPTTVFTMEPEELNELRRLTELIEDHQYTLASLRMSLANRMAQLYGIDIVRQSVELDLQRGIIKLHLPDPVREEPEVEDRPVQHAWINSEDQ